MTDDKPEPRTCIVCRKTDLTDDQSQTCTGCLNRVRINLNAIVDGYTVLPHYLHTYPTRSPGSGEGGSRNAETPLMGGDVLSLIGYGGDAPGTGLPTDPPSVLFELERWEADWRHVLGLSAASTKATITVVSTFLHANLGWAAQQHPAFYDFADDTRRIRSHIERALGTADRPIIGNTPCMDCGERLARRWTASGLEDAWTCLGCRRTYELAEYYICVEAHQVKLQEGRTA